MDPVVIKHAIFSYLTLLSVIIIPEVYRLMKFIIKYIKKWTHQNTQ